MTDKELINMFRDQIFPLQAEKLKDLNFEGKGEIDKFEYLRDTSIILNLAEKGIKSDWIHVSKSLPEKDGSYLVTSKYPVGGKLTASNVFECIYIADVWIYHGWETNEIIAWMPKPEPYKENKE